MEFAWGVFAGGVLVCLSFALLARKVDHHARQAVLTGRAPEIRVWAWMFRLVVVLAAAWLLLGHFNPLSLLIGFSCIMAATVFEATMTALRGAFSSATEG